MLFELEPDESLTGGFAYGDNKQFDDGFITALLLMSASVPSLSNSPLTQRLMARFAW